MQLCQQQLSKLDGNLQGEADMCCNMAMQVVTMRAARGLLESKLTSPQAISDAPLEEEVEALHSQGNVQRGKPFSSTATGQSLFICPLQTSGQLHNI